MIDFTKITEEEDKEPFDVGCENPTVIKIIGCGGGGSSAVKRLIEYNTEGVEFYVINTDLQALKKSPVPPEHKLEIGQKITGGLGAGGNPEVGEKAAQEDAEKITKCLQGADMVIITAGMGGGTGTGSIPIVAELARKVGALTIAVVTTPFEFEGSGRMKNAKSGLEKLRGHVDSLITIPNQQLMKIAGKDMTFTEAFRTADNVLCQGVQGISEIITKTGEPNIDFADVKSVMFNQGEAILGVGFGEGENRAVDAANGAISNKMLECRQIDGAKNILINITSSSDFTIHEAQEIVANITASANPESNIFWGQVLDQSMEGKVAVTVIATGFDETDDSSFSPAEDKSNEDETIFNSGEFIRMTQKAEKAEKTVDFDERPKMRESGLGVDRKTMFDGVPNVSKTEPPVSAQIKKEEEKPVVKEAVAAKKFSGRMNTADVDPNDPDTPAYLRRNLNNLPRSINL